MGLLSLGTPLAWDDAKRHADHVRSHGITQFLNIWDRLKDRCGDELLWGDEIEYMVVSFDHESKNARLSLRQSEILAKLKAITNDIASDRADSGSVPTFHPEYGRFMLESTPGSPYTGSLTDLLSVEGDMRYRRRLARKYLKQDELPFTLTSYPRLGVSGVFTDPYFDPENAVSSHSLFLPEEITNPHARFPTLTANIRRRRGSKVVINLPLFIDKNTPRPFVDPTIPWQRELYSEDPEAKQGAALNDHIYMDAMGFGMGCSCLQITFQSCNVTEARRLYDALVPIAPLMLALTAASPLWRGYIADVDCRWDVISASVDDRTEEERGLKNIQSTNWQTLRFKPPPINSPIGWRVEFRSMEVQITDFENAAFSVFVVLLSRAILSSGLNLYIPISKVDENMSRAQKRDAVHSQKFFFRKDVFPPSGSSRSSSACSSGSSSPVDGPDVVRRKEKKLRNCFPSVPPPEDGHPSRPVEDEYEEMTMEEIMFGKCPGFPGLFGLVYAYLDTLDITEDERCKLDEYLDLIKHRTNGSLKTAATWLRDFVRSHPSYKFDSVVSQEINYDLMIAVDELERGVRKVPDFLPTKI
ncbi:uncharacterized protein FIBRA_01103 [Fibroporia radiculosa]|uniref:Glutamate--cysteine ligase n=1 Tax=Fibroporia radiculosa TaxID=599839 RepID=J4H0X1_9APHY|nr:uncharacterized protein FIBRA_01103 [Fibroporia radiculosa]CCL99089.1 predicted protein [Fibroporia radiculosa]